MTVTAGCLFWRLLHTSWVCKRRQNSGLPRDPLHNLAPVAQGWHVPARDLCGVVGAAQGEQAVEPRFGLEAGALGGIEASALHLEGTDAARAQPRRVVGV